MKNAKQFSHLAALLVCGLCIGWLFGMSASPVLHILVGAVVTLIGGIVSGMVGISMSPSEGKETPTKFAKSANPWPIAIMLIGIVPGAALGIYIRTNDLLGTDAIRFIKRWNVTGLSEKELSLYLFSKSQLLLNGEVSSSPISSRDETDKALGGRKTDPTSAAGTSAQHSMLFRVSVTDRDFIAGKHGADLRSALKTVNDTKLQAIIDKCSDEEIEGIAKLINSGR